jgi:protein-disulfide isomerase
MDPPTTRRWVLQGTGAVVVAALAGCTGDGDAPENRTNSTTPRNATDSTNGTPAETETPEPTEEDDDEESGDDSDETEAELGTLVVTLADETGTPVTSDVSVTVEHERESFSETREELPEGRIEVSVEEAGAHTVTVVSPEGTYETVEESVEMGASDESIAFALVERELEYDTSEIEDPAGDLIDVPIPERPENHEYALAGTGDAPVMATVYGGWKCSYTLRFVQEVLPALIDEFVHPGDVDIRFRAVGYRPNGSPYHGPDGVDAARAGLGVWYHDPDAYWRYFEAFFHNMRQHHGWAETETVMAVAEVSGVSDRRGIEDAIEGGAYRSQIDDTMEYAEEYELETIPRMIIGDEEGESDDLEEVRASDLAEARSALRREVESV